MLMVLKKAFLGEIQPFTWCVELSPVIWFQPTWILVDMTLLCSLGGLW